MDAAKKAAPESGAAKKSYNYIKRSWTDETGKRHFVYGATEKEADEKLGALKEKASRGELQVSDSMKVQKWADDWLTIYLKPKVRKAGSPKKRGTMTQKSYEMYEQKLAYILPTIKNMRMKDVRQTHLQKILNAQADLSDSHVKKVRMVMNAMFSQAVKSRIIFFNPADSLSLPAAEKGSRRSLTDYERQTILQVAQTHRCGLWVRFLLATGIRPAESAPLLVSDLYLTAATPCVKIYKAIESGTEDVVGDPKTEAGFRTIPIPASILQDLKDYTAGKDPSAFLFPQTDGKTMLTTTALSNNWRSFARQVDLAMGAETTPHGHIYDPKDIKKDGSPVYPDPSNPKLPRNGHKIAPDLVLYCLRHTYCTDLQKAGVPLNVARYLMGHADISTTANIYTHTGDDEIKAASDLINAAPQEPTTAAAAT